MSDAHAVARDQLRAFIERIERLECEKKTIADDIKDVYGEAKGVGFIPAIIREIIKLRKQDKDERAEREALLDTYMAALGMIPQIEMFEQDEVKPASRDERRRQIMSEDMADHKALIDEMADAGLISEEARHENKALADAVATKFGNGPAMALRSDNGLNIQTKHTDIRSGGLSPAPAGLTTRPAEESVVPHSDQPLVGGDHEVASSAERERETVTSNTGEGAANTALPAKPKFVLRPYCRNPGETCGGSGTTHCHSCLKAREEVAA